MKSVTLRLDPEKARLIADLSRLSGENTHAVLRVLLAIGLLTVHKKPRA